MNKLNEFDEINKIIVVNYFSNIYSLGIIFLFLDGE